MLLCDQVKVQRKPFVKTFYSLLMFHFIVQISLAPENPNEQNSFWIFLHQTLEIQISNYKKCHLNIFHVFIRLQAPIWLIDKLVPQPAPDRCMSLDVFTCLREQQNVILSLLNLDKKLVGWRGKSYQLSRLFYNFVKKISL